MRIRPPFICYRSRTVDLRCVLPDFAGLLAWEPSVLETGIIPASLAFHRVHARRLFVHPYLIPHAIVNIQCKNCRLAAAEFDFCWSAASSVRCGVNRPYPSCRVQLKVYVSGAAARRASCCSSSYINISSIRSSQLDEGQPTVP